MQIPLQVEFFAARTPGVAVSGRSVVVQDALLALLVATLMLIGSGVSLRDDFRILVPSGGTSWVPGVTVLLLILVGSLPLAARRLAPVTVFVVVATASLAHQAWVFRPEPLPLGVLVALYTVAVARRPLTAGAAALGYVVGLTTEALSGWTPLDDDQFFIDLVAVVATVTLGYGVALTRARATLAETRAVELARDQDERMHAAVEQEQARIAREVHDIVAHHVSVIVAQAAAARRVFDSQPQTAALALASVEALGRDALDGVRRLVGLLRTGSDDEDRSPQPTLERLPSLVEQVERAGLEVDLQVVGTSRPLPATVELNAFRIVQEALTNSLRHAGASRTTVLLEYRADELRVEVRDHGSGRWRSDAAQPSAGYGLVSMQQRAALLGGQLEAGPYDDGFRVVARFPVDGRIS